MVSVSFHETDFDEPAGDPDTLVLQGWVYRDVSWCAPPAWQQLMEIIGDGNYKTLAMSVRQPSGDRRGQLLISPNGISRCAGFVRPHAH